MKPNIVEVLPDLFFIERGYLNANHFVYRGDPSVLIDSGYVADFKETARVLNELGVGISDVGRIISTHCHCDHIGGNKIIYEHSGCDIILHEIGKHFIESGDDWSTWWRYYNQQADFFPCAQGLEDGDLIAVGPHRFEVIYTPGHAADGIVLYNRKDRLLISSDTLWEHDLAAHTIRVEGNAAVYYTKKSLEKISGLKVSMVCPGHGPIFTDIKSALQRSLTRIDGYLADRRKVGTDVLKKITVYTLLMKKTIPVHSFFDLLMDTHWFTETVDLYFDGAYRAKYEEIITGFLNKGIIREAGDNFYTTVKA
jgi:hydroxyacylglutathione hydrolase